MVFKLGRKNTGQPQTADTAQQQPAPAQTDSRGDAARRAMYERIARGGALADAEDRAVRQRDGK